MPLFLRPATEADSPHIGRIGAAGFADTLGPALFPAHLRHLSPNGDAFKDEAEWRAARNTRRMREGKVTFVVVDKPEESSKEEEVCGFAQWEAPKKKDSEVGGGAEPPNSEADTDVLPPSLDAAALRRLWDNIEEEIHKLWGEEGHSGMWYLMLLGVDPNHQRRGVGKMLVRKGIELAERDGTDAYLIATPNGQKLYESCGFKQVGEGCDLGGVPHYSMLWKRSDKVLN